MQLPLKKIRDQLRFWARRKKDPDSQSEIAKDKDQNATFLYSIPKEMKMESKKKPKYDSRNAQIYWSKIILEIEKKIKHVKMLIL